MTEEMRIEYVPLDEIVRWPRNPKAHAEEDLDASIARFGYVQPMLFDEGTGRLVGGHGRLESLARKRDRGEEPPRRIRVEAGRWLVPVVRGVAFESEAEAEAYLLADNRLVELGGWDNEVLLDMVKGLDGLGDDMLSGVGFDDRDLSRIHRELAWSRAGLGDGEGDADEEKAPEPPKRVVTKRGDLWILGDHRLVCGDCTDARAAALAHEGIDPFMMATDPPYGVEYDPAWRAAAEERGQLGKRKHAAGWDGISTKALGTVSNDDVADWRGAWEHFRGDVAYVWHASVKSCESRHGLEAVDFEIRAQIVWAKPYPQVSRGHYHWQHEPCWYAVRKGKTASWTGDRSQSTVWKITPIGDPYGNSEEREHTFHGTQKPIEAMLRPILNHGGAGSGVYDPFLGSGTTLVAAEKADRRCAALELDPTYCDIVVERWQNETGKKAKRKRGAL